LQGVQWGVKKGRKKKWASVRNEFNRGGKLQRDAKVRRRVVKENRGRGGGDGGGV